MKRKLHTTILATIFLCSLPFYSNALDTLNILLAGNPPFVMQDGDEPAGISVEVWEDLAYSHRIPFRYISYLGVDEALKKIIASEADLLVGPISITSDRADDVMFTQPYFISSYSIVSPKQDVSLWSRIRPFFSKGFFIAVLALLLILTLVGTLLWLMERRKNTDEFPMDPRHGIPNGIWLAVVTMTTVGYGDTSPKTSAGKVVAGIWMVVALIAGTSLVAGIASTFTVSGLSHSHIQSAEQLAGKKVGVVGHSPVVEFIHTHGGIIHETRDLATAFESLSNNKIDAIVFDRPQLIYYMENNPEKTEEFSLSLGEYLPQGYGFATPNNSRLSSSLSVYLLEMQEGGEIREIVDDWLSGGENK